MNNVTESDNIGRPLQGGVTDHQEVQRRYDKEATNDVNYALSQKEKNEVNDYKDKLAYIKGEKTICCWSCQTILMVKEEWSVVQCTNCEKINRIPGTDDISKQIRINDNLNHFDIKLPYVFVIITCPFCRTENKARKDAEHVVCFKCHNSVSILQEEKIKYNAQNNMSNMYNQPGMFNPPNRSNRANDIFFPQPSNYYPNTYQPYPPQMHDPMERHMERLLELELKQKKLERNAYRPVDRARPLRDLIKTVDEISDYRARNTPFLKDNNNYNENRYKSPLKSDSVYQNMFSKNNSNISNGGYRPESYQQYKSRDRIGNLDSQEFVLSPYNKKFNY